ncbi:MAG: translocation/assembly module TamB domain-containing protein, partial [Bacteroidota bacterium]
GVTIDLDLNVTPDAYAELIFDAQKGDIIRGRTQGALQVQLNKSGELSVNGGLEIISGAYNFTVPGINKEFQLRRGGTISWTGDPYDGQIDLEATYRQIASLQDWDPSIENTSKIPFLVVLDLQGAMMKPQIVFSIETDEVTVIPGTQADLRRFLLTVNDREDELNRQVFSLLMLRRLSPQNSFQLAEVGRGISSSVSEILSNQLSYWLSQSDENLEVDIDLAGLDQDAFNTFQYRLAYSFFDGRLKVSGGNSFDGPASQESEIPQANNNLFDNWSVEYLISPDGRLRVKVFSRVNPAFTNTADNFQETGASVQYVQSFNQFRELISRPNSKLKDKSEVPIPQGAPTEDKVTSDF